jgi:hypothetical protein
VGRRREKLARQDPAMTKLTLVAIAPLAALALVSSANAQQCAGHCSQCQVQCGHPHGEEFKAAFHENLMWPQQYVKPSRRAICQAFDVMVNNGWRRNNLLGKYDFAPDGEEGLSEAGKLRVTWILTQAPPNRRTIFVQRGIDQATTAARIEAVQTLAANFTYAPGPADVQESHLQDDGHPASSVDAVFTGFNANQMPPILPQAGGASSSTGGEQ